MTRSDLEQAILQTLENISRVQEEINRACEQMDTRRLRRKLKELQFLQIWQMEKLERMSD
jgi:CBS-domain-containing membrane protein